ncbi:MAG: hypothetical protein ACKEQK_00195, partial [Candidatus Hodgkinia cicadicola]
MDNEYLTAETSGWMLCFRALTFYSNLLSHIFRTCEFTLTLLSKLYPTKANDVPPKSLDVPIVMTQVPLPSEAEMDKIAKKERGEAAINHLANEEVKQAAASDEFERTLKAEGSQV